MARINKLLIGDYRITHPYETNNSYAFKKNDVPATYLNLNEPKDAMMCDLGGDICVSVRTFYSNEKILKLASCESHNKWAIKLNPRSSEPLITIFNKNTPILTLMDSGAEISAISGHLVNKLGLTHLIDISKQKECKGPSGENLKTAGTISIKFKIGNEEYREDFLIIETLCSNLKLSYPFMRKHRIRLYCGNIITNSEENVPPVTDNVISNIRTRKEIKYLKLKPSKNYEILEN